MIFAPSSLRALSLAAVSAIALVAPARDVFAQTAMQSSTDAAQIEFDIPAQPLASALLAFSRQARMTVVAPNELARGRQSPAVVGAMTPHEALARLVASTNLRVQTTPDGGLALVAEASPTQLGAADQAAPSDEEEIVVIGTHINGIANETAPVVVITEEDINRSGYSTTQELLRSVPQNFSGGQSGASEDGRFGPGALAGANFTGASGVNLRGPGNSSTLVLVNGRRLAPSAFGDVVDISPIPLPAIKRVEILTDGSSAIYGSDAVAGAVNIVLRDDFEGAGFGNRGRSHRDTTCPEPWRQLGLGRRGAFAAAPRVRGALSARPFVCQRASGAQRSLAGLGEFRRGAQPSSIADVAA